MLGMEDNSHSADPYHLPPSIRAGSRDLKKRGNSKTFGVDRHSAVVASNHIGLKETLGGAGPADGMLRSNEMIPRK